MTAKLVPFARMKSEDILHFTQEFLGNFLSPCTKRSYLKDLQYFFEFLHEEGVRAQHPADITSLHFQRYRDGLIEKKYSPASINRRLVCIRSFLKWAQAKGLIERNPLDTVKLPKVSTLSPTQAMTDEEARALIEAPEISTLSGNTHRLALVLFFYLGLRRSELASVKLQDIQEDRGHFVLHILGKGQKSRMLPLAPLVLDEINAYIQRFELITQEKLMPEDFLIQTQKGGKNIKPCDGATLYRIVERYARALGINKKVGPHSCRATAISHLLDTQQIPLRDVAIFAGHSQTATTERYDKKRKGLDDSAAYKINFMPRKNEGPVEGP